MTDDTAREWLIWAKQMFGAVGDDYLQYTHAEAVAAEKWIDAKREAAKGGVPK